MTIDEAIRIIDPDTTREALAPYADCDTRRAVVDEACRVAVRTMRERNKYMECVRGKCGFCRFYNLDLCDEPCASCEGDLWELAYIGGRE